MNLGGEQAGNAGKNLKSQARSRLFPRRGELHLQNLSNWPARICETAILKNMANNKRVRMVFYVLAIVEMILLSAFYSWGRVIH
jgi:hypothetical protein